MAPNAVTTGHCQIQLRPGATVALFLVDPGQSHRKKFPTLIRIFWKNSRDNSIFRIPKDKIG